MRIGILTLNLAFNYGGILQAYALQIVLKRMGHEVVHVNQPFIRTMPSVLLYVKRLVKILLCKYRGYFFFERKLNELMPLMTQNTMPFIHKYIDMTEPVSDPLEIEEHRFDAIVVGSDQIWRPAFYQKPAQRAFLDFAQGWDIKRVSYAASFGTDSWEYSEKETSDCRELAQLFDAISVREIGAIGLCNDKFGVTATHVLDPTLLLDTEDYIKLIEVSPYNSSDGTLFYYILDMNDSKQAIIDDITQKKSLKPFCVNSYEGPLKRPVEERVAKPVEVWLRAFYDSEYIITDSFHACIFSIIFRKPFAVIANKERGLSRFNTLLGSLELTDRLIENLDDVKHLSDAIDYESVYEKIDILRKQSLDFLNKSLK